MRGMEAFLLTGFLGLVGVGVWNAREWFPDWATKSVASSPTAATKTAGPLGAKANTKPGHAHFKHTVGGGDQLATSDIAVSGFPMSQTEVIVPVPGFPRRKDLRIGTTGAEIRARFGEPNARVTETRGGRVVEQYYYFNRDRTQLTVATLESGILVSAESTFH